MEITAKFNSDVKEFHEYELVIFRIAMISLYNILKNHYNQEANEMD